MQVQLQNAGAPASLFLRFKRIPLTVLFSYLFWLVGLVYYMLTSDAPRDVTANHDISVKSAIWAFVTISAAHQFLIFCAIHKLDHNVHTQSCFRQWLQDPGEWSLRFAIVLLVFCVGGEVPMALQKIFNLMPKLGLYTADPFKGGVVNIAYPMIILGLFCFLLLWDCLAIWRFDATSSSSVSTSILTKQNWACSLYRKLHIAWWFLASDALGFLCWLCICISLWLETGWPITFCLMFMLFYSGVVTLRMYIELYVEGENV